MADRIRSIIDHWVETAQTTALFYLQEGELVPDTAFVDNLKYGDASNPGFLDAIEEANTISSKIESCVATLNKIGVDLSLQEANDIAEIEGHSRIAELLYKKTNYLLNHLGELSQGSLKAHNHNPFWDNQGDLKELALIRKKFESANNEKNAVHTQNEEVYQNTEIPEGYDQDPEVRALYEQIAKTREHFFITGRAGTGKSTFLHFLKRNLPKNVVVIAPSGVAARNVQGQTIHSFFKLPQEPIAGSFDDVKELHEKSEAYQIMQNLDTVVIDEVSMLRADILTGIDLSLRKNTGNTDQYFGGKQVILIGDLFQLRPILKKNNGETNVYRKFYRGLHFFHSPAFKNTSFRFHEFQTVHRQKDPEYIELLEKIRIGTITNEELQRFNKRAKQPQPNSFELNLFTTNNAANTHNAQMLDLINEEKHQFHASIDGDIDKKQFMVEEVLTLKVGAQVLLIKNDPKGQYVNGTIGTLKTIEEETLLVEVPNGSETKQVEVGRHTWYQYRYYWNREKQKVESEAIGSLTQFPLKLGWGLTIHKSQGLTLDKMCLDLRRPPFSSGQTYVGLSRCKSFEGLSLKRPLKLEDIQVDPEVLSFYKRHLWNREASRTTAERIAKAKKAGNTDNQISCN